MHSSMFNFNLNFFICNCLQNLKLFIHDFQDLRIQEKITMLLNFSYISRVTILVLLSGFIKFSQIKSKKQIDVFAPKFLTIASYSKMLLPWRFWNIFCNKHEALYWKIAFCFFIILVKFPKNAHGWQNIKPFLSSVTFLIS